jgi:cyclopropane fatty-acyl-phospholipid synthase-like methyltransferase
VARALALVLLAALALRSPQTPLPGPQPDVHPDVHFAATPQPVADAMLKLAHVTPADIVYDLGSGDGRIVIAAAKKFGARGVGVELDGDLVKTARKNAQAAGVADRVTFLQQDLFKTDFSDATVVMLYLSNSVNMRLRALLERQLKPGSRIVSHRFPMGDWQPDAERRVEGTTIYLWRIDDAVPGGRQR